MDAKALPRTDALLKQTTLGQLANLQLASLLPQHLADYRDRRLRSVKPATIRKELYLIGTAIDVATKEWGFPFQSNPMRKVALPVAHDARDRRLQPGEEVKLRKAIETCRNALVGPIVELAIETGLRRGELGQAARR